MLATITGMTGAHHHTQPYAEMEYWELFPPAGFEL
jgi:hypothetical protein